MTDPDNENNEEQQRESADNTAQDSSTAGAEDSSAEASAPKAQTDVVTSPEDGLPEDEELTPEIVEEEAIRGDFMLRWAAVFLAVLFGFSQMADTRTLVHIRSGEQLRANGFVPSSHDSFSYALDGQSTANVSWLFDHVVSAVYSVGGENLLTIFKALIAGLIAYLLTQLSMKNMPTWWNSICVVMAMAACSVDFLPVTDLATLLGLSMVMLLLHWHSEGTTPGLHWKLPVLLVVWANCDPRAYLGVIAITLFAAGFSLRKRLAKNAGNPPGADASTLWKAAAFSLIALAFNPSPVASVKSIATTYSTEYPTMAVMKTLNDPSALLDGRTEYYSIFTPGVMQGFEFAYVAGFSILVIALIVLVVGRSREDLPWLLMCLGFGGLALWKLHELPAAALVAAATAGTAAQRWYGRTFRQEYTIDTMDVLFSRGGRAVTVLAMAVLGFFAVGDRLPTRTAIGMGFEPDLRATIDSLGTQLAEFPDNSRFFNTAITQGDLLIWHGRQSFTDSRTTLFGNPKNEDSVLSRFLNLRKTLMDQANPPAAGESKVEVNQPVDWQSEYNDLGITQLMLRLAPPGYPAYSRVLQLIESRDWTEVSRGPSAAIFSYGALANGVEPLDIRKLAFRDTPTKDLDDATDEQVPLERFDFAQEASFYQKYLYNKRPSASASLREAEHLLILDLLPPQTTFQIAQATGGNPKNVEFMSLLGRALAGPTLAIRGANAALLADPQNAAAYRTLGLAYKSLRMTEQAIAQALNSEDASSMRYFQAVMAFRQASVIEPEKSSNWENLAELYAERNRIDLALECLTKYLDIEEEALLANMDNEAKVTRYYDKKNQWQSQVDAVLDQVEEFAAQPAPEDPQQLALQKFQMTQGLAANGYVRLALEQMKKDEALLARDPKADLLRGELMLEAGQLADASEVLNRLAEVAGTMKDSPDFAGVTWHRPVALSHLGKAGYGEAISAYQALLSVFDRFENKSPDLMQSLVQMLPLVPEVDAVGGGGPLPAWPMTLLQQGQLPFSAVPASRNEPRFMTGLAHLEDGNILGARKAFTELITEGGETPYRGLAAVYLLQLSDDAVETISNSFVSTWEDFVFPGDEPKEAASDEKKDAA